MKKINFLIKLAKEKKIQAVEPNDEIKEAYIQRSNESLSSAKALVKMGNLKDAVALAYYSMYHCLLAVLFKIGIKCENHVASIILLKEVFGFDNSKISKAKSDRIDKQYYIDFSINVEETKKSIKIAEEFITNLNNLIATLTKEKVEEFHKNAVSFFTEEKKPNKKDSKQNK